MKYQQGDVLLTKIDESEEKDTIRNKQLKKDIMNKVVIRYGEATGHHHRFELKDLAPGTEVAGYGHQHSDRVDVIKVDGGAATMIHEEHNPINIPPGMYKISQVREFDHLSMTTRLVMD
jgi:hypothetical protein